MITVAKLRLIQYVLRTQLLPIKGTNLSYSIGKNLYKIDFFLEQIDKRIEELKKKFIIKNDKGDPIYFMTFFNGQDYEFLLGPNGEFVEANESTKDFSPRIESTNIEYINALNLINSEEFNDFHVINEDVIQDLSAQGKLDSVDLAILIGNVIR